jgi:4-amino-4-deoxy-L-arabinose transferase-like glycosyltransferase
MKKISFEDKIFVFLVVIITIINLIWVITNDNSPKGDGLVLVRRALYLYESIKENSISSFWNALTKTNIEKTDMPPSPLLPFFFFIYYYLFGTMAKLEMLINIPFLVLLTWGTYKLGSLLYGKKTGLLASIVLNGIYAIIFYSKTTYIEFHLLCIVSVTYYFMFKTENFNKEKFSILLGLFFGISSLVKYTFFIYIFPQIFFYYIYSYKKNKKKAIKNMLKTALIFILVSGLWYIPTLNIYYENIASRLKTDRDSVSFLPILSSDNILMYPTWLLNIMFGIIFSVIIIIALVNKLKKKPKINEVLFYSSFIIPLVFFTFFSFKKHPAFMVPALLPIPILISDFLMNLNRKLKNIIVCLFIIFIIYNFGIPFYYHSPILFYGVSEKGGIVKQNEIGDMGQLIFQKDRDYEWIIKYISNSRDKNQSLDNESLLVATELTNIYFFSLDYYSLVYESNLPIYYYYKDKDIVKSYTMFYLNSDNSTKVYSHAEPRFIILVIENDEQLFAESVLENKTNLKFFYENYEKIKEFKYPQSTKFPLDRKMLFFELKKAG